MTRGLVFGLAALLLVGGACRDEAAPPTAAISETVRVVRVQDGDSLELDVGAATVKVRLFGVDAPEKGQDHGDAARDALEAMVRGQRIHFEQLGSDRYGRLLVKLHAGTDSASVNERLVAGGHAWHYARYSDDPALAAAELGARAGGRGLWAGEAPVPPWEFRASRRGQTAPSAPQRTEAIGASEASGDEALVIGNRRSRKYHVLGCPGYRATAPTNRVPFESPEAAEKAGFKRAGNCP